MHELVGSVVTMDERMCSLVDLRADIAALVEGQGDRPLGLICKVEQELVTGAWFGWFAVDGGSYMAVFYDRELGWLEDCVTK